MTTFRQVVDEMDSARGEYIIKRYNEQLEEPIDSLDDIDEEDAEALAAEFDNKMMRLFIDRWRVYEHAMQELDKELLLSCFKGSSTTSAAGGASGQVVEGYEAVTCLNTNGPVCSFYPDCYCGDIRGSRKDARSRAVGSKDHGKR